MSPEFRLIVVLAGVVLALAIACVREWILARRAERQLESEFWMRAGFYKAKRMGWLPEDKQ